MGRNPRVLFAAAVLSFVAPAVAAGQGSDARFTVQGGVGGLLIDGGNSQSVAIGFIPDELWEILISAERLHVPTEVKRTSTTSSVRRGGTAKFISAEVRLVPATFGRISPYALVSVGRGISRPNVNEIFTDPVENDAFLWFAGGGVRVSLAAGLSAFADMRLGFQTERDSIYGFFPLRGGVAWRF